MSAPRTPGIYICMMTLVTVSLLGWSSCVAPCVEVGVFLASAISAVGTAFMAWRLSEQIGQKGMLLVYVSLAALLIAAVTALVDFADLTFLGEKNDAESGLLLGGFLAFAVVGWIAVRLSRRFPLSLALGSVIACVASWGFVSYFGKSIEQEYQYIITMAALGTSLLAFLYLCRCRHNLNSNQYISVLSVISVFVMFCAPSSSVSLLCSILAALVMLLSGLLVLGDWQQLEIPQRIAASMLVYVGFSGTIEDILKKGLHLNETVSCIPTCFLAIQLIFVIRLHRHVMERGLYWAASCSFGLLMLLGLIPEAYSADLFLPLAGVLLMFLTACILYAPVPLPRITISWKNRFAQVGGSIATLFTIAVTAVWLTTVLTMLLTNIGTSRLLALLKPTPLWPGNQKFVEMVMREESLWPDEIRNGAKKSADLELFLKQVRPAKDRFSSIMETTSYENMQRGVDYEDIGVLWAAGKSQFSLKRVNHQSPAGEAGLDRGDRVIAINGKLVKDIPDDVTWEKVFGVWKTGTMISMNVIDRTGMRRDVSLAIGTAVQDQPVSKIIPTGDGTVGYLYLEGFSRAQFKDIKKHFAGFKKEGVRSLVLDLRYNSGGIIDNASLLTDLIAGQLLDGKPFVRLEHSERFHDRNTDYVFERLPESPYIKRIVILTTRETCSASEAVINGLKPYMPVTVVGAKTCGKPFSMHPLEFGGNMILPVTARVINSKGEGYYSLGIKPDIAAKDDLTHQLGDPEEGMLKKALEILK